MISKNPKQSWSNFSFDCELEEDDFDSIGSGEGRGSCSVLFIKEIECSRKSTKF